MTLKLANGAGHSSAYRSIVVELPWPDRLGRIVLVSIDAHGRIFDQRTADTEYEVDLLTDRMVEDMESAPPQSPLMVIRATE